ncbi:hypothetical protein LNKW23_13900 [Paralimibaculum aggregatum]|uniref:DUF2726 domain-containing protein n=1 Tax=Paralimibaculum aggregatum TaxID=3036245 RepID=A0ABQ6LKI2_9RHOB|nr:DUF2726 domain-containing protein [Limibaculum sp. NKW23]GMG82177.1 hypothetical protein LNKW23_13900 [Limibaculum sp. NKW23]
MTGIDAVPDLLAGLQGLLWPLLLAAAALAAVRLLRAARRPAEPIADPAVTVTPAPIWNRSEGRLRGDLLRLLEETGAAGRGASLHAQVALGAVFGTDGPAPASLAAFRSIAAKRFDFLVVDAAGRPLVAVEFHGAGHRGNGHASRDRIKRTACRRAGLALVEIDHREDLAPRLREIARHLAAPEPPPPRPRGLRAMR